MPNAPFSTDHLFVSDGRSPYCAECELLTWMHGPLPASEES